MKSPVRVGTRGSPLARAQTALVINHLTRLHGPNVPDMRPVIIKTTGDRFLDRPVEAMGGKGVFTKEIDHALLEGTIDLAVHAMKDVPTGVPEGIIIPCLLARADARDFLVIRDFLVTEEAAGLDSLPVGARVGSSSLRRRAQLLHHRPDLTIQPLRGNVGRRLDKLAAGEIDATVLAIAGLRRLGRDKLSGSLLGLDVMLPAPAQGAIGVACRGDDHHMQTLLSPLHDPDTGIAVAAERAFLAALEGDCRTPAAAHARLEDGRLHLEGLLATPDGRALWKTRDTSQGADAQRLGLDVATRLKARAGQALQT